MIKMREVTKKDLNEVAEIAIKCFPNDFLNKNNSFKWILERFEAKEFLRYHVAEINNEIVGYIYNKMLGGVSGILELEQIGVSPRHQGKGVGKTLILGSEKFWIKYLRSKFNKKLYKILLTTSEINNKAHNLYSNCGFKYETTIKNLYFGTNEGIWIKKIK